MARAAKRLTARGVTAAKAGRHADGDGLYLVVDKSGARRWLLFVYIDGKRREMGLGSAGDGQGEVTLATAREAAAEARKKVREGIDPIAARRPNDAAANDDNRWPDTFGPFAAKLIDSIETGFRNVKHRDQWRMTLSVQKDDDGNWLDSGFCKSLRHKRLDAITTDHVLAVLSPIWTSKSETASRLRGRVERVLDAAKAKGLRSGENPALWRGHLKLLLPARRKLTRGHHKAMPYAALPALVARLGEGGSVAALALEWTILAAARTGETIGARLSEIDRTAKVWVVPKERMKAGREHRVPLTDRMLEIYDTALLLDRAGANDGFLFPGARTGQPLSQMAMAMLLRRMKVEGITVHGFRSSFRDWVGDETPYRPDLAEAALAHVIGDKTEAAYRRTTALEMRRRLMSDWADFVTGKVQLEKAA